jgi:hypothetical protein
MWMDLKVGMLWFDDARDRTLAEKIVRAASHYRAKYGCYPDTCYVPLPQSADIPALPDGIRVKRSAAILPDHLWLGVA